MRRNLKIAFGLLALVACTADDCTNTPPPTANQHESAQQNAGLEQVHRNQPAPTVDWSFDREVVVQMFLARQHGVATYSVVYDQLAAPGSRVEFACPSLGYPVPYSTQITNPHVAEKLVLGQRQDEPGAARTEAVVVDQAEPNGLFPPGSSEATWVPCVGDNGQLQPQYIEDHVSTFAYPVQEDAHGRLVKVPGAKSSVNIDPTPAR